MRQHLSATSKTPGPRFPPPMMTAPYRLPHTASNRASALCQGLSQCPTALPHVPCSSCCWWPSWTALQTPCSHPQLPQTAPGSLPHPLKVNAPQAPLLLPWFWQDHTPKSCLGPRITPTGPHPRTPRLLCCALPQLIGITTATPGCSGMTARQDASLPLTHFPKGLVSPRPRAILPSTPAISPASSEIAV